MTRRHFIFALAPVAGIPAYGFAVEPRWLELTQTRVSIPGLSSPVRVLHLSDFHFSPFVPLSTIDDALEIGLSMKPDLICLTGDFITNDWPVDWVAYAQALKRCSAAAPTFACLGNHDGGPFAAVQCNGFPTSEHVRKLLADSEISLLYNRYEYVRLGNQLIRVAGIPDLWEGGINAESALSEDSTIKWPTILLAHNPDSKSVVANFPWDLMLSGHTHGGQVLIPLVGNPYVPVQDKRFISGLHSWAGRQVYVTRGVGNLAGVRMFCRPEVTVLDLVPERAGTLPRML